MTFFLLETNIGISFTVGHFSFGCVDCFEEYFKPMDGTGETQASIAMNGCKLVLNSKSSDETLVCKSCNLFIKLLNFMKVKVKLHSFSHVLGQFCKLGAMAWQVQVLLSLEQVPAYWRVA